MHDLKWSEVASGNRVEMTAWCPCGWASETRKPPTWSNQEWADTRANLERAFVEHLREV